MRKQRDSWRFPDLLAEAWENAFGPGSRLFAVLSLAVLLGICFTGLRAIELHQLRDEVATQALAGRNLITFRSVSPDTPSRIERASCDALARVDGVTAAGALSGGEQHWFAQLASPAALHFASVTLLPEFALADVVIGSNLIDAPAGTLMQISYQDQTLSAVVGAERPTGLSLNNAVVVAADPNLRFVPECIVLLDQRQIHADDQPALAAMLRVHDHSVTATTLYANSSNPFAQFHTRWARFLSTCLGALIGVFIALAARFRASELATYLLSGTGKAQLFALLMLEAGTVAGVYWLSGAASAAFLLPSDGILHTLALLGDHLLAAATTVCTASLLCIPFVRTSPMLLAKDR